jgi:hypothetical protein
MSDEWKLGDRNKSIGYLLPFIGEHNQTIRDYYSENKGDFPYNLCVNIFSACEEFPELKHHIFVLYKYNFASLYQVHCNRLEKNVNFVDKYSPDNIHNMFIFEIPEVYRETLQKFRDGQFSKFKDTHKQKIMIFNNFDKEYDGDFPKFRSNIPGTLFKQQWKKEEVEKMINKGLPQKNWTLLEPSNEYSSIPLESEETFLNKYKVFHKGVSGFVESKL